MDDWRTSIDVFMASRPLQNAAALTGDLFLPERLDQWAEHNAVDRTATPTPDLPMKAAAYRINVRGERLRDRLDALENAPRLPIMGMEAYAGWVLLDDGRLTPIRRTSG